MNDTGKNKTVADILNELREKDKAFEQTPQIADEVDSKDVKGSRRIKEDLDPLPHENQLTDEHIDLMKRLGCSGSDNSGVKQQPMDESKSLANLLNSQKPKFTVESVAASIKKAIPQIEDGPANKLAAVIVTDHS